MKSLKTWSILLVVGALLSGCAGAPSGTSEPSPSAQGDVSADKKNDAQPASADDAASAGNLTEPGTYPIVKEKVTLTAYAHPTPERKVDSYGAKEGNAFAQYFEDLTNVQLDFIMAPSAAEVTQDLSIMLSSGQAPDIMLANSFTSAQQEYYCNQGVLMNIAPVLEKNAFFIKRMWDAHPEVKEAITLSNGKIVSINNFSYDPHGLCWNKMWVYKPWLDKLNLPIPETTEQFYNTLVAFRDNDMDGDGDTQNEIPLMGNQCWVAHDPTVYLMNAFIYNDSGANIQIKDGKVFAAYTQDAYKEGLKWINKLYTEGLISPETYSLNDMGAYNAIADQPNNIIGFMPTHAPFVHTMTHYENFAPVPPLTGPNGVKTAMKNNMIAASGTVFSADCKNPDVAVRVIDSMFDFEKVGIYANKGREGKEWDYAKNGELNSLGEPAKYVQLTKGSIYDPNNGERNVVWPQALYLVDYTPELYRDLFAVDPTEPNLIGPLEKATLELYVPTFPSDDTLLPPNLVYDDSESAEISDLQMLIDEITKTNRTQFILGEKDIETGWSAFQEELKASGLERYLEIVQSALDKTKK